MNRSVLLAVVSAATLAVVGLMYVSRADRFGKIVLPVPSVDGVQTVTAPQPVSVQQEERSFHGSAGLQTEGERQMELFASRIEEERGLYGFNNATQSPEDNDGTSLSQGNPLLHPQKLGSEGIRRHQTLHQQKLRNKDLRATKYYDPQLPSLPPEVIDGVEKFVFFIGHQRSGHSIIGSMMDAHPNMIISHEFKLFKKIIEDPHLRKMLHNKTVLFNALYQRSYRDAKNGWRSSEFNNVGVKGYTLHIDTPWHAKFNGSLKVIGDKSGCETVITYREEHRPFLAFLTQLNHTINIPMRVIHVVRNPYDMIATESLFRSVMYTRYVNGKVNQTSLKGEYRALIFRHLRKASEFVINIAQSVDEMIHTLNLTVLEVHSADFTRDPMETIMRICAFLDLPCPKDYLQACYDKAYKTPSKSRDLVYWPEDVITNIEASLKEVPFFRRYSFEGD